MEQKINSPIINNNETMKTATKEWWRKSQHKNNIEKENNSERLCRNGNGNENAEENVVNEEKISEISFVHATRGNSIKIERIVWAR